MPVPTAIRRVLAAFHFDWGQVEDFWGHHRDRLLNRPEARQLRFALKVMEKLS